MEEMNDYHIEDENHAHCAHDGGYWKACGMRICVECGAVVGYETLETGTEVGVIYFDFTEAQGNNAVG
jgi:hypothetical protein